MTKLVLASQSLGRKKLLDYLQIPYEIIPSEVDEDKITAKTPLDTLQLRARLKAENVAQKLSSTRLYPLDARRLFILSADSGAILDAELIGKPKDKKDAVKILKKLSGRTHQFVTAVYIVKLSTNKSKYKVEKHRTSPLKNTQKALQSDSPGVLKSEVIFNGISKSSVTFRKLDKDEIDFYLKTINFRRYAASYALVSAQNFITRITGSTSNIIGLPLEIVIPILREQKLLL